MEQEDAPTVADARRPEVAPGAPAVRHASGTHGIDADARDGAAEPAASRSREPTGPSSSSTMGATSTLGLSDGVLTGAASTLDLPRPETVLRRSAYEQTKRTAVSGLLFNLAGLVGAPLVGGDAFALEAFLAAMALGVAYNGWLLYQCRREATYRQRHAVAYFTVAPFTNTAVLYYLGTFGPVLVMFVLNVYTACLAYSRRVARLTLAGAIAPVAVLGGLMASGVIADPGMIGVSSTLGPVGRAVIVAAFIVFLVLTYGQARKTRELMVASLVERDAAVRLASHREALVHEARQDLDRALSAGGLGRFSDRTLGSFKLGAVLGRGGMGEVYEAVTVATGEPAAVKMLLPEVLNRPAFVHRFLREVRIAASLEAENVVRVLEVGDESAPMPYLAMERLSGEDLSSLLRSTDKLDADAVLELVRQVGCGLDAAADAGIVHRDLKPQNLFRTDAAVPVWKILDFGVSKLMDTGGGGLTRGEAIGTPRYMAPEQARGEDVDRRADLYSLGVVAYRALTGHPPFKGDEVPVLVEVLTRMPVRPGALLDLPSDVDAAFALALAKRPEDRFPTGAAFALALAAAFRGELDPEDRRRAQELLAASPWRARRGVSLRGAG